LPEIADYFGRTLGLQLPATVGFDPDEEPAAKLIAKVRALGGGGRVDGFVTDERLAALAARCGLELAGSVAGSHRGNNKLLLHQHLETVGEPVFETLLAGGPDEVAAAAAELARRGFEKGVVKSQIGASGIGLVKFRCDDPPRVATSHFIDGPCLVQGWVDEALDGIERVASPSVQMLVTDRRVDLFDVTDQILSSGSIHEGNASPPVSFTDAGVRAELLRQAEIGGRWLHAQGYRGTASTDFHLAFRSGGGVEVRVCELNARVTGATYPSLLARHFRPGGAWLMRNLRLPDPRGAGRLLANLREADLLYDGSATAGVLPVNLNYGDDERVTKGQFLVLGDTAREVDELLRRTVDLETLAVTRD